MYACSYDVWMQDMKLETCFSWRIFFLFNTHSYSLQSILHICIVSKTYFKTHESLFNEFWLFEDEPSYTKCSDIQIGNLKLDCLGVSALIFFQCVLRDPWLRRNPVCRVKDPDRDLPAWPQEELKYWKYWEALSICREYNKDIWCDCTRISNTHMLNFASLA